MAARRSPSCSRPSPPPPNSPPATPADASIAHRTVFLGPWTAFLGASPPFLVTRACGHHRQREGQRRARGTRVVRRRGSPRGRELSPRQVVPRLPRRITTPLGGAMAAHPPPQAGERQRGSQAAFPDRAKPCLRSSLVFRHPALTGTPPRSTVLWSTTTHLHIDSGQAEGHGCWLWRGEGRAAGCGWGTL